MPWLLLLLACRTHTPSPSDRSPPVGPSPREVDAAVPPHAWQTIAPGVEHRWLRFDPPPPIGEDRLDVVRLDPHSVRLQATLATAGDPADRTTAEDCGADGSVVVTNLGMFHSDNRHVGWLRRGPHVDQPRHALDYRSWLLAGPHDPAQPAFRLEDGDERPPEGSADWTLVTQNLRLIARPGVGVWKDQPRRWTEAALAMDAEGRLLLLHTRAAWTMAELTRHLLRMPLGIVAAQHLEGGPEASLSICTPALTLHRAGGFETGFSDDRPQPMWPIPNRLRVVPVPPQPAAAPQVEP